MSLITRCDCDDCYNMDTNYDREIYYVSEKAFNILGYLDHICQDCWENYIQNDYPQLHLYNENGFEFIGVKGER